MNKFTFFLKQIKKIINICDVKTNLNFIVISFFLISLSEVLSLGLFVTYIFSIFDNDFSNYGKKILLLNIKESFYLFTALVLLIFFLKSFYITKINKYIFNFSFKLQSVLSKKLLNLYLNLKYSEFIKINSSTIIKNIATETRMFAYILNSYFQFISEFILLTLFFIFLAFLNFKIFLCLIIVLLVIFFITFKIFSKKTILLSKLRTFNEKNFFRNIKEIIDNFKILKIDNKEKFFLKKFYKNSDLNSYFLSQHNWWTSLPKIWIEFFTVLFLILIFAFINLNNLTFNKELIMILFLFFVTFMRTLPSINKLIYHYQFLLNHTSPINLILSEYNKLKQNKKENILSEDKKLNYENPISNVKFVNVNFYYDNNKKYILKKISASFENNKIYAILGESGSGKTTFIDLLMGFLSPKSGKIEADGKDIKNLKIEWKKNIAYVPQSISVFNATAEYNITLGEKINSNNKNKLLWSLKKSKFDTVLKSKKNRLKFKVFDGGKNLSGGQIQRLGIARGLFKNAKILILDEPTSSLDNKTKKNIIKNLIKLKKNRIVIVVTHDKNFLKYCDEAYELKNGSFFKL